MPAANTDEDYIGQALQFLRTCVSSTPLKKYESLFEGGHDANDALRDCLMEGLSSFQPDLERWGLTIDSPEIFFDRLLLAPNLQATYLYRVCRALHLRDVDIVPNVLAAVSQLLTGVQIYYSANIGPGLKVIHGHGTIIGAGCRIGSHFTIYQNVTVGDRLGKDSGTGKRPVIGDYVIASAGAQILGPITIGFKTIIGANAVVIHSLPARCIAAGIPAKVKVADMEEERFLDFWQASKG